MHEEKKSPVSAPRKPKTDKKGFRILKDEHDLYRLFGEEGQDRGKTGRQDDDFARLLDKYQDDREHQRMMRQKIDAPEKPKTPPVTVGERLKTYPAPQLELDLHGYTSARAEVQAAAFIRDARLNDILTVRIIVGKGLHSEGKAVLPDVVENTIIGLKRKGWVLAYKWEKKDKRKSGALIVYLVPDSD